MVRLERVLSTPLETTCNESTSSIIFSSESRISWKGIVVVHGISSHKLSIYKSFSSLPPKESRLSLNSEATSARENVGKSDPHPHPAGLSSTCPRLPLRLKVAMTNLNPSRPSHSIRVSHLTRCCQWCDVGGVA
ncbi:hypothetical protein BJX66DRAFT_170161 [Aspergillus keveii]|uniref:Uncharacterized protein n=1 Tax=Aspergillus keveii TaxID=714993 RepID=A0ABR4G8S1_9EURO